MKQDLSQAIECLKHGKAIIYPTESCYSLGCDAKNKKAVAKIHALKKQLPDKPMGILVADIDQAKEYGYLNHHAHILADALMPGRINLIIDSKEKYSYLSKKGIAFRVSLNQTAKKLIRDFGSAITTSSANLHGHASIYKIARAKKQFGKRVCAIVDEGDLDESNPVSTIYDTRSGEIIRRGPVSVKVIEKILVEDIKGFFAPKSIAVIGASRDPKKVGHQLLKNIIDGGYSGRIYPINLDEKEILGLACHQSVTDVPKKIDLAVIAIPAEVVPKVLRECVQKKIKNAVIISAGFGEAGDEGKKLEAEITKISQNHPLKILGPNCLGFISAGSNLNATFARSVPKDGSLMIISQSGALGAAILDWAKGAKIGISKFVSLGNKTVISEIDALRLAVSDPQTKTILLYLEDTKNGQLLCQLIRKIAAEKEIVVIKGGQTSVGQEASASHTGALASSAKVFIAAVRECGAITTNSLEEAFDVVKTLYSKNKPADKRLAIITNAGGPGIIATDLAAKVGLEINEPSAETIKSLTKILPAAASLNNPIDILGDASAKTYQAALATIIDDDNFDAILTLLTPQAATEIEKTAEVISAESNKSRKPVFASFIGGDEVAEAKKILGQSGVASFDFPEEAIRVISRITKQKKNIPTETVKLDQIDNKIFAKIKKIIADKPQNYPYQIAKDFGLPVVKSELVRNREELTYVAKSIGYPLVLKTLSDKVIHKSFAGGVVTNIKNEDDLLAAHDNLSQKFGGLMTLSPFISDGFELYIGAKNDPDFGPVVLFGLGGVYVEALADTTVRLFPLSREDVAKMITEIRADKIITGYKNHPGLCHDKLVDLIFKTGQLIQSFPEISEIDFNPVKATKDNLDILDTRIVLK